jgi:homoserine kinase
MKKLHISVPATSANLGPGFDALGMCLDITDAVCVELTEDDRDVVLCHVAGEASGELDPHDNLLCRAYKAWFEQPETQQLGARFSLESRIPVGKGLGSSAAAIVAGLTAAAFAAEEEHPRDRILELASRMEGHADNAVAAVLGGLTVGFIDEKRVYALPIANHLGLGVALYLPDETLLTEEARAALPTKVPREDAIFDLGRLAYLTTALIWGRWDKLWPAMQDRLHQPYRLRLIPALDDVVAAAIEGGAYGAALSGGGPSIIALGPMAHTEGFAAAMEGAAHERGWPGHSIVTRMRESGVQVKEDKADEETKE